ncbi:MAG: hypothetical protein CMH27_07230 [Micavibrio sp.]|nr:hypothetical protein [Micavibrio sp.]|tara:strand:+ start:6209 stop:6748 length:540 start_codon:yes stop_codon:yes gene_type:complete
MTPRSQVELIALYLGKPWKFLRLGEATDWRFEIIDGTGRGLYFRKDGKQFRISGSFPRDRTSPIHCHYKTIGVSIERPARDIAADIKRRLLPHYMDAYEKALVHYREQREQENHLNLVAQALIKVTGGRSASYDKSYARTVYFTDGQAEIYSSGDVSLELRKLSPELAIKIASMIVNSD